MYGPSVTRSIRAPKLTVSLFTMHHIPWKVSFPNNAPKSMGFAAREMNNDISPQRGSQRNGAMSQKFGDLLHFSQLRFFATSLNEVVINGKSPKVQA